MNAIDEGEGQCIISEIILIPNPHLVEWPLAFQFVAISAGEEGMQAVYISGMYESK